MLAFDFGLKRGEFALQAKAVVPTEGVIGLIGVSGAGKSSLLRSLAGLESEATGRIALDDEVWLDTDQSICRAAHERQIGFVFQRPSLFPHLNVRQNLEYASRRASKHEISVDDAIAMLGIESLLSRDVASLSGGEAQRVAIARALCTNPRLLLLDEPLASVDVAGRQQVLKHLEALRQQLPMPVLYVSHALDEVVRLADYLMLMDCGAVTGHGIANDMLTRFDLPLAHDEDAEVVIEGVVKASDAESATSEITSAVGPLFITRVLEEGAQQRLRIHARDVSISLSKADDSSILNILPATIEALEADRPGQCLIALRIGEATVLARLSQRSVQRLELVVGKAVFAQIKSVALA